MHLALVGAFPFPHPQGSQVFFADQGRALTRAGARVTLVCYGSRGAGEIPEGLALVRAPLAPRRLESGPAWGRPVADAALAATLLRAHRARRFDALLAHNSEAALAALAVRAVAGIPVIYVAHTLLGCELETYGPPGLAPPLRRAGAWIDAAIARAADAILALSQAGARALGARARGPVAVIPPGLDPAPDPSPESVAAACRSRSLEPGRFVLYAGNLDPYQNLGELARAARFLGAPVVVVTHAQGSAPAPLRTLRVDDPAEQRRLLYGAAVAVLPRRVPGGFPIKLLNYMEASRPIAARQGVADTLVHGQSGWLLSDADGGAALSRALRALLDDAERAARLGREGRRTLEREHAWPDLARRTLDLAASAA